MHGCTISLLADLTNSAGQTYRMHLTFEVQPDSGA